MRKSAPNALAFLSLISAAALLFISTQAVDGASYPLCPLTKKPPSKPLLAPTRCMDTVEATCCENCFDYGFALAAASANESTILEQFAPTFAKLLGGKEIQLCSIFVGHHECADAMEQVNCAMNCNPDSGSYMSVSDVAGTNPTFRLCDGYAQKMFDWCYSLPVPGTTAVFGSFLNTKELLLTKTFGAIFGALGYLNTTLEITNGTEKCYNGPKVAPPRTICCDTLATPNGCPASVVKPAYERFINRTLDAVDCAASSNGTGSSTTGTNTSASTQSGKSGSSMMIGEGSGLVGVFFSTVASFLLVVAASMI